MAGEAPLEGGPARQARQGRHPPLLQSILQQPVEQAALALLPRLHPVQRLLLKEPAGTGTGSANGKVRSKKEQIGWGGVSGVGRAASSRGRTEGEQRSDLAKQAVLHTSCAHACLHVAPPPRQAAPRANPRTHAQPQQQHSQSPQQPTPEFT